ALAVKQYEACALLLKRELGIEPGAALQALRRSLDSGTGDGGTTVIGGAKGRELTIAILPFVNMSGDSSQQYFSDGITQDIIADLARFRSLAVIARNSSFQHRDKATDVRQVARELGAQYVVEGSIRKAGGRLRVTAQLIDAATGRHVWADRFDRPDQDIFAVQDEIVSTIVGTLVGRLHAAGAESARRKPPASLEAYECVLRGNSLPFGDRETE